MDKKQSQYLNQSRANAMEHQNVGRPKIVSSNMTDFSKKFNEHFSNGFIRRKHA